MVAFEPGDLYFFGTFGYPEERLYRGEIVFFSELLFLWNAR